MFTARHVRNAAAGLVLAAAFFVAPVVLGRTSPDALPDIAVSALPSEARTVLAQVQSGGPFRHERDGVVFGNREYLLPAHARGYYHEYTVPTPGVKGRGARRIVCGGPQRSPAVCYYTADHYQSFARIRE
ncbi:MAG: ribonuclease domain-containing protein [Betaproteobacteria bacterium]